VLLAFFPCLQLSAGFQCGAFADLIRGSFDDEVSSLKRADDPDQIAVCWCRPQKMDPQPSEQSPSCSAFLQAVFMM
jgi:hypothetical protein